MSCFVVEFILCRSPGTTHYLNHILAYDMGEATTVFFNTMKTNLGFNKKDLHIRDILEMK